MGNDGGSIPTRRELVKEAAQDPSTTQLKETQNEQQQYHWTTCPLSHQLLSAPIVSDSLGILYNKIAILESLIEAGNGGGSEDTTAPTGEGSSVSRRVKSLRDVVEVIFQEDEENEDDQKKHESSRPFKWFCPITNKPLGPGVKAVYLVPCGHAFSETAIKEMSGETCCLQCSTAYTSDNIIPILPTLDAEKKRLKLRAQMLNEQGLSHSLKKAAAGNSGKKRKKNNASSLTPQLPVATKSKPEASDDLKPPASTIQLENENENESGSGGGSTLSSGNKNIRNEGTAALTAKVLQEQEDRQKRRRLVGTNENLKSLFSSSSDGRMQEKQMDFMTRGFSIPANAKR